MEALKKLIESVHDSVLNQEAVDGLNIQPGRWYVDATFGGGGHTMAILERGGNVLALDQDQQAIQRGLQWKAQLPLSVQDRLLFGHTPFSQMEVAVAKNNITQVQGVILDVGLSSDQLDDPTRGFAFMKEGPLDMRMNTQAGVTAHDLLHALTEQELQQLFSRYGELPKSRTLAKRIIEARSQGALEATTDLRKIIESVYYPGYERGANPIAQAFQALRIVINDELGELEKGIQAAIAVTTVGGRIVVISFHSLEDRIAKTLFRDTETVTEITKKAIVPSQEEIDENPRSRSAKLRIAEKHEHKNKTQTTDTKTLSQE